MGFKDFPRVYLLFIAGGMALVVLYFALKIPREPQYDQQENNENIYNFLLADTVEKKVQGLSGMEFLPEDKVMLFAYKADDGCTVWMKDMLFSIDVVWLDKNFKVIDYRASLSPQTYPQNFSPSSPCRYFIETNNGFIKKHNVRLGQQFFINFDNLTLFFEELDKSFTTVRGETDVIRLFSPKQGEEVASPLVIKGEARGIWFFEATFPVILTNWDGLIIAEHYAQASDEWMTEDYVPFEATLEFENPVFPGVDKDHFSRRGYLILHKNNPSGLPENDDALEITVRFK